MANDQPLELIADFCNTRDERIRFEGDTGLDHISTIGQLREWLLEHDLITGKTEVSWEDLRLAQELRKGIRMVIDPIHVSEKKKGVAILGEVARCCPLVVTFDAEARAELSSAYGEARRGITTLLIIIVDAERDGSWKRLKMCAATDCRWVFVDRSRPGTGRWCSMKACGNRAKKRAFRSRQKNSAHFE